MDYGHVCDVLGPKFGFISLFSRFLSKKILEEILKMALRLAKIVKYLNFSRSAILKIIKNIFFLKTAMDYICLSYL